MFCFAFGFVVPARTKAVCSNWVHPVKANVLPSSEVTRTCHTELDSLSVHSCSRLQICSSYRVRLERTLPVMEMENDDKRERQKGTRSGSDDRTGREGGRERILVAYTCTLCAMPTE
jgi:hypothetical protein